MENLAEKRLTATRQGRYNGFIGAAGRSTKTSAGVWFFDILLATFRKNNTNSTMFVLSNRGFRGILVIHPT